jgi:23S rRNA (uracil1939-C5)-methyltransferase
MESSDSGPPVLPLPAAPPPRGSSRAAGVSLCPVYERCGGCPLLGLPAEARGALACAEVERLSSASGLDLPGQARPSFYPAPDPLGYRNRVRLAIGPGAVPRFFNPEKVPGCAVLSPSVIEGIGVLTERARAEPALLAAFVHLELRARDELGRFGLRCTPAAGAAPPPAPALGAEWLTGVSGQAEPAMPRQRWRVSDECCIDVPLDAFLQVNLAVNRALVGWVVTRCQASGASTFADLFMGAGNFTLPLLACGLSGAGVERHAGAVAAARDVASERGLCADLVAGDALAIAERWSDAGRHFDVVVCDPPRAGLGARAPSVARLAKRSIALVSCRLDSACADAVRLVAEGIRVESVALFDMFPQTRHVEAVIWLERC